MEVARDSLNRNKFEMCFCGSALSQVAYLGCQQWLSVLPPRRTEDQDHHRSIKLHSDHETLVENSVSCSDNIFSQFRFLKDF